MKNVYSIYKHTNIKNGKSYIGQTNGKPENRWRCGKGYIGQPKFYNAIIKYGWNGFTHEIIDTVENREDADLLEKKYIEQFDSIRNGYNVSYGGVGNNVRKVLQLDEDFNIIGEFNSISNASLVLGLVISSISNCCNFKRKSTGGYHFCFIDEYDECVRRFKEEEILRKQKELNKKCLVEVPNNSDVNITIKEQRNTEKKVVGTQVSLDTYTRIKELAEKDFMSISDYLRKIIILHLREVDKEKDC